MRWRVDLAWRTVRLWSVASQYEDLVAVEREYRAK
jgi:hypothetical protein